MNYELDEDCRAAKILCIDDDPEISRTIELRLQPYCATVLRAFHGMQGFWMAMTEKPDLIITDINMPQGKGDYVVECLCRNAETRDIPVIVLSGQKDSETQRRLWALGIRCWFSKPCSSETLIDKMRTIVEFTKVSELTNDRVEA